MMSTGCDAPVSSETATVSRFDPYRLHRLKSLDEHRRERRRRRWSALRRVLLWGGVIGLLVILLALLSGCQTIDPREECCERVELHFRYSKGAKDELPTYIHKMHYFIFDAAGRLQHAIERSEREADLRQLHLGQVQAGKYTVLAIGNATDLSQFFPIETHRATLSQMILHVQHPLTEGVNGDSDPLYYGIQEYEVKATTKPQSFLCDLSNAHCRLTATFRWADTQPEDRSTPFTLELIEVASNYRLSERYRIGVAGEGPLQTTTERVVHSFPYLLVDPGHPLCRHQKEAPYLAGRVRGELRTLRYSDDRIPALRLLQGTREVMRPLPLEKIFRDFKWAVDDNIEQKYELEFTLYDDGRVEVRSGSHLQILDWINGGTIG